MIEEYIDFIYFPRKVSLKSKNIIKWKFFCNVKVVHYKYKDFDAKSYHEN